MTVVRGKMRPVKCAADAEIVYCAVIHSSNYMIVTCAKDVDMPDAFFSRCVQLSSHHIWRPKGLFPSLLGHDSMVLTDVFIHNFYLFCFH